MSLTPDELRKRLKERGYNQEAYRAGLKELAEHGGPDWEYLTGLDPVSKHHPVLLMTDEEQESAAARAVIMNG